MKKAKAILSLLLILCLSGAFACANPPEDSSLPSAEPAEHSVSESSVPEPVSEPESDNPESDLPDPASGSDEPQSTAEPEPSEPASESDESDLPDVSKPAESAEASQPADESAPPEQSGKAGESEPEPDPKTIDRSGSRILVSEGCSYTATGEKHYMYADDGTHLTDGKFGGDVGYGWTADTRGEFVVDLGKTVDGLADFTIMLASDTWGLVPPTKAEYSLSDDGSSWTDIGTVEGDAVVKQPAWDAWNYYYFPLELERAASGRYVRIVLTGSQMGFVWAHEIGVWTYESEESRELHAFKGTERISNLTFTNRDDNSMGDMYAPGYCVYSKTGYNKGEFCFELSQVDAANRGSKKGHVTCYVFLGIGVNNDAGYWMNCCDAGFAYDGDNSGWHLFWATATDENGKRGWNADSKALNPKHDYKLVLDSSKKNGKATVTAIDLYDNSVADSLEFDLWGSKADGSNTYYLTDIAIDWADAETLVDTKGNPTTEDNWVEITLANMGQGIHLKNVRLYGIALYAGGKKQTWKKDMTDHRGIWSDAQDPITVETTVVHHIKADSEYIVDLDLG
ncbi:MAG: hypothetical protein J5843_03170 [Clostridia bacterium]|nr:hypothetical protein [Clostridia bacterium]